jgi:hypothetical protein
MNTYVRVHLLGLAVPGLSSPTAKPAAWKPDLAYKSNARQTSTASPLSPIFRCGEL